MRKGKGKMKILDRNLKYLSILIMILIMFGFSAQVHGEGGDIMWSASEAPTKAGKQEARAMAVDPSNGYSVIAGYSDQSGSDDYYTILIDGNGSIVTNWPKSFDNASGLDRAEAVVFDNAGKIIVTGYSMNADGNMDFHTIKYDTDGAVIWEASYSASVSGNDYGVAVAVDSSNNVYVGGYSQNASANNDYKVVKYPEGGGNPLWVKTYNGASNGEDTLNAITVTANGVAVTGESHNGSDLDCVTIKYDLTGNLVWSSEQRYDGPANGDDKGVAVRMDSAGNVVVTAISFDTDKDIYTVKYNSATGAIESGWPEIYDGGSIDEPADIFIDSVTAGENVYVTGDHKFADGSDGFYTAKYNSGGTLVWEDVYHSSNGNANDDSAVSIVVNDTNAPDAPAAVFVTGSTFHDSVYDFRTIKYTINTGKLLWQEAFSGSGMNNRPVGIGLEAAGDVIVAGWTEITTDDYEYYAIKYKRGLLNRPTDLALTVVSTTRIDLAWTDNSSNETGFKIERKEGDFGSWSEIYAGTTPGQVAYSDTTVNNDTKYYYRVRAYSAGDNSNYSNELYAVTTIQTYTSYSWKYNYDNLESNEDLVIAMDVGPDYHPAVTGYSYSALGTFDYYTVKINRNTGLAIWAARYDGDQNGVDQAAAICVDSNNDVLVSGFSYLYSPPPVDNTTNDIYTLKYLSAGPPADWVDQYNGPAGDDDRSVVVDVSTDSSNNYIVVGYGKNASLNDDVYVIKYDTDGNVLWEATPYDGGYNDYPIAAAFDPSGSIIVAGYTSNGTDDDFFTAKYDSDGNLDSSWSQNPVVFDSGFGADITKAMTMDSSGNIYVTGIVTNAQGDQDFYTVKYNGQDGTIESGWPVTYGGYAAGFDEPIAIAIDPVNNEVVVAGSTYTVNGENDFHTIRYDTDGTLVWQRTLDRPDNNDFAVAMAMDLSGNVHIAGDSENAAGSASEWDVLSIQYDHNGSFIKGTIVNGAGDSSDGAAAVTVNVIGEAFIGGNEDNIDFDSDYLVFKVDGDELQVPIPFAAVVHYRTVDFTWVDNSEDEISYQLQRNDTSGTCDGAWSDVYNAGGIAYTDDNGGAGLAWGTTYCYRIRTYKNVDEYSRWVDKTITTVDLPEPSNLQAFKLNTSDVYLTWTDTTTSENKFNIERCSPAGLNCPGSDFAEVGEALANAQSYTDTTACEGTEYYYQINAEKTSVPVWTSGYSNNANATTGSIAAPDGFAVTRISEVQIDLSWNDNSVDETGFRVERCLTSLCTYTQIVQTGLDSAIVMLLNMDEGGWLGTSDEAADSSGSGNDGTAQNGATTVSGGQYGYAGSFDGSDDYIEAANSTSLNILDDLTIELWFKPAVTYDSSLTDYVVLLDRQWAAGTDSYFLGINSAGNLYMSSGGGSIQSTQTTWTAGQWYHVVVTYRDVSGVYSGEMYIDGVSETLSVNSYDNMSGGTQKIGIGGSDRFNNFAGTIDRVALYNRALTATEADDRFNNVMKYSDSSVPDANENYTYRVRAYKTAAGCAGGEWNTAYSATASADATVDAPTLLTATPVDSTWIELEWTDNTASETGFRILRCVDPCTPVLGDEIALASAAAGMGTRVSYSDKTVCEGNIYSYRVVATNSSWSPVDSGYSNEDSAETDTAYAPVALPVINTTESQIEFEWSDNTYDETGFRIERCNEDDNDCAASFVVDGSMATVLSALSGNVMLLHMDETYWDGTAGEVTDSSGSGNSGRAYNGATTDAGGKIGRAGSFNETDDQYVATSLNIDQSDTSPGVTMEAWVKPASTGGWRTVISSEDDENEWGMSAYDSTWRFFNGSTNINTGFTVDVDEWQHIAAVFTPGTGVTFYKNGVSYSNASIYYNTDDNAIKIGRTAETDNYHFDGLIDEVAIYTRPLTNAEITTRYLNGRPSAAEGTATGGSDTTVQDTNQSWTADKWIGYYVFITAGTNNVGEIRQITGNTSDTLTVNAYSAAVTAGDSYEIVSTRTYLDTTGLDWSTNYTYRVRAYKTASGCAGEWESANSLLINTSTDDPKEPTDLDATIINTTDIRLDWTDNTTSETDFEIERKCTPYEATKCPVPDTWSRVNVDSDPGANLTANATYTDDTACEDTAYVYQANAKRGTDWTTIWSVESASETTDDYIAPSVLTATTVTEEQIDITWTDNTVDETSFKIERCLGDAAACASGTFVEIGTLTTAYGDLLVYHMDEASWGTVIDSSEGGSYNGTAYGNADTDPGGKFGRAGIFDGSGDYISTSLNLDQSDTSPGVTMEAWVKPAGNTGLRSVIATDDDNVEWGISKNGSIWRVYYGSGYKDTGFTVDVDEWQHIAAVFTPGVGVTFYKNGASYSTTSIGYNTDDRSVTIGRRARYNDQFFDGLIDEVAIYNRPLSFAEIYQLDEDSGDMEGISATTMQDTDKSWAVDEWANYYLVVLTGSAAGESRKITSNTSDTLTIETFGTLPGVGDTYKIFPYLQGAQSYGTKRFSDTGRTIGLTYSYRVRGYKNVSCEWPVEYSNIDDAEIIPPAPSDLTANSGGTTQIELSWTDNTQTETGFKIYRCDGLSCIPVDDGVLLVEVAPSAGTGVTSYTDSTVAPGVCESQPYSYSIVATSSSPAWDSLHSNVASATADSAPAPSVFTATQVLESEVELSWIDNTVDEEGFRILRCVAPCTPVYPTHLITTLDPNFEVFTDTGLAPDTSYNYEVHAYKIVPTCPWDESAAVSTPTTTLTAPVLTATAVNTTRIDLAWTNSTTSETGFSIEKCEVDAGCPTYTPLTTVGPDVTSYTDEALCDTRTYQYQVKAVNEGLSNSGGGCWTRNAFLTITDFQPNYPTKVEITTYDSDMQSDFSDIRFYDATAELELPYHIESKTDGVSATIYVKTMVNNDIYMYYGNSSATSSSNADRVYEFYDDFQGTFIDNQKWYEIDSNNKITQNDDLILLDEPSNPDWNKALISQQTFNRVSGKELYVSLTTTDSANSDFFIVGWERDQLTSADQDSNLRHAFYWASSTLQAYEYWNTYYSAGSYSFGSDYTIKIALKDSGAKYYIKGGTQFPDWTFVRETTSNSDSLMRIGLHQYNHGANIHVIKIQNYAPVEPGVVIGSESGTGCFSFSTVWTSGPDSNMASDTTKTPVDPTSLAVTIVNDTRTDLSWIDNTDDETGFKVERCLGTDCTPSSQIGVVQGYDPSIGMLLRMDESSWHGVSGEVADSVGSNNGTAHFGANTTAAGFDRAGSFDGVSDYVTVPNSSSINPTEEITVALWAASDTATWNATGTLASKRNAYIMYPVSGSKEIRFYVYTTLKWYSAAFTPSIDITQWHHYVGTYDGNEIKLYIDGSPVDTTARKGGINADTGALYIGMDDGQSAYFDGLIDEVIISDRGLSDTEVYDLYSQEIASNTNYSDTASPSLDYCYYVRAYKTAPSCSGGEWNSGYSNRVCIEMPPGTPANLQATAYNSLSIDLAWDGSGVTNELGFVIERKIWGGTYIVIATIGPDINSYYDAKGLEPEQTYTYRMKAYNAEGSSDYSNEVSETTLSWQDGDGTCE